MKCYKEKREVLCNLAELYLDTKESSYISVKDCIMDSSDLDSVSFLILLALTYPKEEMLNIYSMDLEIDDTERKLFVEKEYRKITKSSYDKIKQGKIILDDAKFYYNTNCENIDYEKLNEITKELSNKGIYI